MGKKNKSVHVEVQGSHGTALICGGTGVSFGEGSRYFEVSEGWKSASGSARRPRKI